MFRCDFCDNYKDKSECEENPTDTRSNICEDCLDEYHYETEKTE